MRCWIYKAGFLWRSIWRCSRRCRVPLLLCTPCRSGRGVAKGTPFALRLVLTLPRTDVDCVVFGHQIETRQVHFEHQGLHLLGVQADVLVREGVPGLARQNNPASANGVVRTLKAIEIFRVRVAIFDVWNEFVLFAPEMKEDEKHQLWLDGVVRLPDRGRLRWCKRESGNEAFAFLTLFLRFGSSTDPWGTWRCLWSRWCFGRFVSNFGFGRLIFFALLIIFFVLAHLSCRF